MTERQLRVAVRRMRGCLSGLDPVQARLLSLRAGLHGKALSLGAAAKKLGLSHAAAGRLEEQALSFLRLSYAAGGCGHAQVVSVSSSHLAPLSARVPSSPSGGTFVAAELPSAEQSTVTSTSGVKGVQATGTVGGGDTAPGASAPVHPAGAAEGVDAPAKLSILGVLLSLLAMGAGLAVIARQRQARGEALAASSLGPEVTPLVATPAAAAAVAPPAEEAAPGAEAAPAEAPAAEQAAPAAAAPPLEEASPAEAPAAEEAAPAAEAPPATPPPAFRPTPPASRPPTVRRRNPDTRPAVVKRTEAAAATVLVGAIGALERIRRRRRR